MIVKGLPESGWGHEECKSLGTAIALSTLR
jgi:hypothetical protein